MDLYARNRVPECHSPLGCIGGLIFTMIFVRLEISLTCGD